MHDKHNIKYWNFFPNKKDISKSIVKMSSTVTVVNYFFRV